jgi:hypothetical protein
VFPVSVITVMPSALLSQLGDSGRVSSTFLARAVDFHLKAINDNLDGRSVSLSALISA